MIPSALRSSAGIKILRARLPEEPSESSGSSSIVVRDKWGSRSRQLDSSAFEASQRARASWVCALDLSGTRDFMPPRARAFPLVLPRPSPPPTRQTPCAPSLTDCLFTESLSPDCRFRSRTLLSTSTQPPRSPSASAACADLAAARSTPRRADLLQPRATRTASQARCPPPAFHLGNSAAALSQL